MGRYLGNTPSNHTAAAVPVVPGPSAAVGHDQPEGFGQRTSSLRHLRAPHERRPEAPPVLVADNDPALSQLRPSGGTSTNSREMGLAGMTMAEIERRAIIETLRECGGNRGKTARSLGISEKTVYNKIKKYRLQTTSRCLQPCS